MPRGRKQLTDKQERILVQCQLMGLTTADLVTISNRLKALDIEHEFKGKVSEISHGFSWTAKNKRDFILTDSEGHVYEVKVIKDYGRDSWNKQCHDYAKVIINKPGTRYKKKEFTNHALRADWSDNEISSACPDGNKYLYRMMRDIKDGRFK